MTRQEINQAKQKEIFKERNKEILIWIDTHYEHTLKRI